MFAAIDIALHVAFAGVVFYIAYQVWQVREIVAESQIDLIFVKKVLESNLKLRLEINRLQEALNESK